MNISPKKTDSDFYQKLKWLMFFRVFITTVLLSSTIILQLGKTSSFLDKSLLILYGLIAGIFILSFCYSLILYRIRGGILFAYIQISLDTFVVTLIIFITGSFSSLFSFLYLIVIIYASMLLMRKGSMIMASLCSIQYGLMIDLEYYGILKPFGIDRDVIIVEYTLSHAVFKIAIMMVGCFAVAILSSFLAEQERRTKKALFAMEEHVKRVEKMAALGEMASGLAHEIRNPLASLRASIQFLKKDMDPDSEDWKLMNIVIREADRLNLLLTDFLTFARPQVGKIETINLSETLTETLILFEKHSLCKGRISVTHDIFPGVRIEIDPGHLRQVLWNILINAAESIENKGNIHINMYPPKNRYAAIEIIDNGRGIPSKIINSIFDPFITTKPNGTGLGLSIVHRIMDTYDGQVSVASRVGKGTVFTLKFLTCPDKLTMSEKFGNVI